MKTQGQKQPLLDSSYISINIIMVKING